MNYDSTIALEFLLSIKTGIRNSAIAITEIESPKARAAIRNMMNDSISLHGEVTDLMISKGWLLPYEGFDALGMGKGIAPHETFDLHELLTMKNVSATKCFAMSKLVKNEELKSILQQDLAAAKEHIGELEGMIQTSVLASSGTFKTLKAAQTFQPVQTSKYAASDSLDTVKDKEVPPKTGADQQKGASI
jgi:similar to spore coat protein